MRLLSLEKVRDGRYLKNYVLTYENKAGREKKYEIVSRKDLAGVEDLGQKASGVSIVAMRTSPEGEQELLLLREFRMGVNKFIYNLCAGMIEEKESVEECIARELYEESGLQLVQIKTILPPSYAAVAISDVKTYIAFTEVTGDLSDHSSENEMIEAKFYNKEQVRELLKNQEFSSRAQMAAFWFAGE